MIPLASPAKAGTPVVRAVEVSGLVTHQRGRGEEASDSEEARGLLEGI